MIYIPSTNQLMCPQCRKYYKIMTETYLPDGCENDGRIACLVCDTTMAFTWDLPELYLPDYVEPKYHVE